MLRQIIDIARECGAVMREAHAAEIEKKQDDPRNLVTEYDIRIQDMLRQKLTTLLPEATFLGEEGKYDFRREGFCFICDPIDGTTNFIKNLKHSAVSIALLNNGKPVMGVIYDPYLDEMFWAEKGQGAFLNGKAIHTTNEPLANSLIAFGSAPYNSALHKRTIALAAKSLELGLDIRRAGAAVLDLAYVAAGRYGLFWELELQPWDYAAGCLLVQEAGGIIRTAENKELTDYFGVSSVVAMAHPQTAALFD